MADRTDEDPEQKITKMQVSNIETVSRLNQIRLFASHNKTMKILKL